MGMAETSQLSLSVVISSLLFCRVDSARWREGTLIYISSGWFALNIAAAGHLQWPDMYECLIAFKVWLEDGEGVWVEVGHGGGGQGDQPLQLWPGHSRRPLTRRGGVGCEHCHWRKFGPERQVDAGKLPTPVKYCELSILKTTLKGFQWMTQVRTEGWSSSHEKPQWKGIGQKQQ